MLADSCSEINGSKREEGPQKICSGINDFELDDPSGAGVKSCLKLPQVSGPRAQGGMKGGFSIHSLRIKLRNSKKLPKADFGRQL